MQFWSCRPFDNETYSSRTPHARCNKTGKSKLQGDSYKSVENIRENLGLSNNHAVIISWFSGKYTNEDITQILWGPMSISWPSQNFANGQKDTEFSTSREPIQRMFYK